MAYQTTDRIGSYKIRPEGFAQGFLIDDATVIYAHTLCGVSAATGKLVNLEGNENAVSAILYADERLTNGAPAFGDGGVITTSFNSRVKAGGPYETTVEAVSAVDVYLDATGLTAGDEGSDCFLLDDHTVTLTPNADPTLTPYVGKIAKVITADYAQVFVPGLYRD